MLNALKWLVKFLETRFPVKVTPASHEEFKAFSVAMGSWNDVTAREVLAVKTEIEKLQKQIEILNLRVGLTRATQSPFGRKVNG